MPQFIIAVVWLSNHGVDGACDAYEPMNSGVMDCAKMYIPVLSLVFSVGSILYAVYKGAVGWKQGGF